MTNNQVIFIHLKIEIFILIYIYKSGLIYFLQIILFFICRNNEPYSQLQGDTILDRPAPKSDDPTDGDVGQVETLTEDVY